MHGESANEDSGETRKAIGLDQLIQVNTKKFHCDAKMIPEVKVLVHLDDMVLLLRILSASCKRYAY